MFSLVRRRSFRLVIVCCASILVQIFLLIPAMGQDPFLRPPGHRPEPLSSHFLKARRIVVEPGTELANGMVLIRNGRIVAVGTDLPVPADARTWNLTNATIYAGFLDPYVPLSESGQAVDTTVSNPIGLGSGGFDFFGVPGDEDDSGNTGPGYELKVIHPEQRVTGSFAPDDALLQSLREAGFTSANFVPGNGVIRGQSALAHLSGGSPNDALIRTDTFQHIALDTGAAPARNYPQSLMGVIASIRQTMFDARHYHDLRTAGTEPVHRPPYNEALESLKPVVNGAQQVVFEPGSVLMADRTAHIAEELGLDFLMVASGQEWRRPDLIRATGSRFIVPLPFPEIPKLPEESDWRQISLDQLRAWDWAPENPALLRSNKLDIALTTFRLSDRNQFRKNLRKAVDRGLGTNDALAAMTVLPAQWCGAGDELGTIEPGKWANLTIVNGDYFDPESQITDVWIQGRHHPLIDPSERAKKKDAEKESEPDAKKKEETDKEEKSGARIAKSPLTGRSPLQEGNVHVRNATLWTSGPDGIVENGDLLIADGKILAVGEVQSTKAGSGKEFTEVDGSGLHVTPGIIDCHSHSFILGAVNESTLPSTAMVRIGDVINSETDRIYQQLAGGLTVANLLHGSANPIGGQNAVVKLRWGDGPEAMKLKGARPGIKFALGENVKQSNWGDDNRTRFPQTRMGVPVFFENRFTAAQQYLHAWERFENGEGPRPRRNLELEAIGEIIEGERLVHCHSYRQDEIIAFLRTMESFGVRVGTLQHILEGYKVADEIAAHGAGASAFSDWWAYKYEVIDAIPYAGAIMHDRGVTVSFNSDSSDHARRLNLEAAKAVKYGGVSEVEALKFVTLNPAIQLGIDDRVGSLEPGKDADFVLWSGHPLSSATRCLQTWIDGKKYFDLEEDAKRTEALKTEREALIAKAREPFGDSNDEQDEGTAKSEEARAWFFQKALEQADRFPYSCCTHHRTLSLQP